MRHTGESSSRPWGAALAAAAACWGAVGCASDFPKTYPLTGTVVVKGTRKPLPGGTVELESVSEPSLKAVGEVGEDGSFDFVTYRSDGKEVKGVIAGEHRVRLEPPRESGIVIPARYKNFETSGLKITAPAPGDHITLELDPAPAKGRPEPKKD